MKKALVITPTTGADELKDAIASVSAQTYENTEYLIVVDGYEYLDLATELIASTESKKAIRTVFLPYNTGKNGFYGHRIMAGFGHLVPHDYILFLDQDNWFKEDHIESLITTIEKHNYDWAHSLRTIHTTDKEFICEDNCESLGRFPVWVQEDQHLIDSSSYCFTNNFFRNVCHLWDHGWGADRRFYMIVKNQLNHTNYGCSNKYTLSYRLGGNEGSVTADFFIKGNAVTYEKYNNKYPWNRT